MSKTDQYYLNNKACDRSVFQTHPLFPEGQVTHVYMHKSQTKSQKLTGEVQFSVNIFNDDDSIVRNVVMKTNRNYSMADAASHVLWSTIGHNLVPYEEKSELENNMGISVDKPENRPAKALSDYSLEERNSLTLTLAPEFDALALGLTDTKLHIAVARNFDRSTPKFYLVDSNGRIPQGIVNSPYALYASKGVNSLSELGSLIGFADEQLKDIQYVSSRFIVNNDKVVEEEIANGHKDQIPRNVLKEFYQRQAHRKDEENRQQLNEAKIDIKPKNSQSNENEEQNQR